jgi:hypothetical protein
MSGSLQDLLRDANAGILQCTDVTASAFKGSHCFGFFGINVNSLHINVEDAVCDDGYFGGEEFGSANCDDDILFSDNDDSRCTEGMITSRQGLSYKEYGKSDNVEGGYGPLPEDCFGDISDDEEPNNVVVNENDSGSEEVQDQLHGYENMDVENNKQICSSKEQTFPDSTAFGDCGCVSGHNCDDDSGDEDDGDEEEVALADCDLQQELYIDKPQIGVPYKKR